MRFTNAFPAVLQGLPQPELEDWLVGTLRRVLVLESRLAELSGEGRPEHGQD